MKKSLIVVLLIIVLIILLLFIYKRSNKLTCTYNEDYEDIKIENKIIAILYKMNIYYIIRKIIKGQYGK